VGQEALGRGSELQTMKKLSTVEKAYVAVWGCTLAGLLLLLAMAL